MPTTFVGKRPDLVACDNLAQMYAAYEALFLGGGGFRREFQSQCGLSFVAFDRNFFHLLKLRKRDAPTEQLNIQQEKPLIRATVEGLGDYLIEDPRRARYLACALAGC